MRFTIFFAIILIFISCSKSSNTSSQTAQIINTDKNSPDNISKFKLPDELSFCGEKIPLNIPEVKQRAEREFFLLLQQPGQITLYLKRSGLYFPMFERIIKENNMPDDIKYLSVAESALFMARSAMDAVGLWQFIPSTAKRNGLRVDDYVDERRHPEKSAYAAMKYLKEGYNGNKSWIMAAAGYNMGHENVSGSSDFQNSKDFFDLYLNEETSRYILRIVVIKEIMQNHEKYGFQLDETDFYKPAKFKLVRVNSNVSNLSDWARENGTTYKDVKLLNPWILQKMLPSPQKGGFYEIAIPD